ncbi:MAG: NAD(P)-binding domain-containing protein [Methyloceanibacter sp.]
MQVGFIGLGGMGSGMAANLLKAGHALYWVENLKAIETWSRLP